LAPLALLTAADGKGEQASKTEKPTEQKSESDSSKEKPKAAPKNLTGAELYSIHCNRCHPERYPTERTAAQWKTILFHMRVRANLPAEQARTILKYLQDNSGR
jgi:cytochrome c5